MMVKRTMDEMITHFNDTVSTMDISLKDKMTLLGMITAIGYEYQKAEYAIEELQKQIPSADVVEVVRCKDCKNNYVTTHNHGKQDNPRCDFTDRHLSLDDFCSRGERRMDGE